MPPPADLAILMPCKDQKDSFLAAALESVLKQTSPHWRLLVIIDPTTPAAVRDRVASYADNRIRLVVSPRGDLASKLNFGMRIAETEFVCTLHSDDILATRSVAVLRAYIRLHPSIDFFYSSRRFMDAQGRWLGKVLRSLRPVNLTDFSIRGSRVKQLLCWRRAKGLEVGGIDERFTVHGCDDYDFPWVMAEAGATFMAVRACLYYIRRHQEFFRLTTHTPIQQQLDVLTEMFRKHRVSEPAITRYLRRALEHYILADSTASYRNGKPPSLKLSCYGEITPDRKDQFLSQSCPERHFIPHRLYCIPLEGQDEFERAKAMRGVSDSASLHEIVLFAEPMIGGDVAKDLGQLFYNRNRRAIKAQIGIDSQEMFVFFISWDGGPTEVEDQEDWSHMLLNALLSVALEHDVRTLWLSGKDSQWLTALYNHTWREMVEADCEGDWWRLNVGRHQHRVVVPKKQRELVDPDVCAAADQITAYLCRGL